MLIAMLALGLLIGFALAEGIEKAKVEMDRRFQEARSKEREYNAALISIENLKEFRTEITKRLNDQIDRINRLGEFHERHVAGLSASITHAHTRLDRLEAKNLGRK